AEQSGRSRNSSARVSWSRLCALSARWDAVDVDRHDHGAKWSCARPLCSVIMHLSGPQPRQPRARRRLRVSPHVWECRESRYVGSMRDARQILQEANTIAVVGASRDRFKTAHSVPAQMQRHGWRIIPVNPYADQIFGERAYRRLADIPEPVDMVNI